MDERLAIRNFCILAHIDHGKSTLADRLLEITGLLPPQKLTSRFLDSLELERERGVTIKMKAVRLRYSQNGLDYTLNLIDTPGHVDFSYEVSRSLNACEGALLLVDAVAGIQAQTLAHYESARALNLVILPVVNKIDLPQARVAETAADLCRTFGFPPEEIHAVSAKTGEGVRELLAAVIAKIPSPAGQARGCLRALIFDSKYDEHKGVIAYVRVVDGEIKSKISNLKSQKCFLIGTRTSFEPVEIGYLTPDLSPGAGLTAGEIGYVATGLKEIRRVRVGDTLVEKAETAVPLPGYREPPSVVFAGLFPAAAEDYPRLRTALEKLALTDAALNFRPTSSGLGRGFLTGFLGTFHAEIVKERLERDFQLSLLMTNAEVEYHAVRKNGDTLVVREAAELPDDCREVLEPWVGLTVYTPALYLGKIMALGERHRGLYLDREHLGSRLRLRLEMPLAEMFRGYYDGLKSVSSGFASLAWQPRGYRRAEVVRLDVLVHGRKVAPLSRIVLKADAYRCGLSLITQLKELMPRSQFAVALQAAVGGKILARETVPAARKNVLAKLSGGHRERKDKVLERQREGKKRLARFGQVDIPEAAFRLNAAD